jgi:hypothetical protein
MRLSDKSLEGSRAFLWRLSEPANGASDSVVTTYGKPGGACPEFSDMRSSAEKRLGQTVNVRGSAYATCCALQPLVARQYKGRGFGRVYC